MKGILFALGAGVFLACTYSLDKYTIANYQIPPVWAAFCRFWMATIIISIITTAKFQNEIITTEMRASVGVMLVAGITFAVAVWFIVSSMKYLPAGQSTIINNTTGVVLTCIIGVLLLNEQFTLTKLIGSCLCLLGIILVAK